MRNLQFAICDLQSENQSQIANRKSQIMDSDLERKLYYDGITLFNEHEFFDAHEVWEDIWHMAFGTKFEFYQGMIQCAVALEHYRRSNPRGVVSLFESYNRHFKDVPKIFMGLNVEEFQIGRAH